MKKKSLARRQNELLNQLMPDVDLQVLAKEISNVLDCWVGESTQAVANMVAGDLKKKYIVTDKKLAKLHRLITDYTADFEAFLDQVDKKKFQWALNHVDELLRSGNQVRRRPETDAKRVESLKRAKNQYEYRRRQYREGRIQKQFGTPPSSVPSPYPTRRVDRWCLDRLLGGEKVPMSGTVEFFRKSPRG